MTERIDLDTMTEYLLGGLDDSAHDAIEAAIASGDEDHLSLLMEAEALVADLWLAECEPVEPSAGLHDRLFASIEPAAGFMGFAQIISDLIQEPIEAARAYLESLSDPDAWFPGLTSTSWIVHVEGGPARQGAVVGFIRIDPGGEFPDHRHAGEELMFVLQGTIIDGENRYERGQLIAMSPDTEHNLTVAEGEGSEPAIFLTVVDQGLHIISEYGEIFFGPSSPEI